MLCLCNLHVLYRDRFRTSNRYRYNRLLLPCQLTSLNFTFLLLKAEAGLSMGIQGNGVAEESSVNASVVEVRESFLVLMGQVVVSLVTISTSNGSHHPSPNGKILWDFAAGNCIIGYISLFTRLLIYGRQRGLATRIVTAI